MNFENPISLPFLREQAGSNSLQQENSLTRLLYEKVQHCRNTGLNPTDRSMAWRDALDWVTDKYFVRLETNQNLRHADYSQPLIDKSTMVDDRVLGSFSPRLKQLVDKGEVDTQAAFAILEYYLRSGYHNLNQDQTIAVARMFVPRSPHQTFKQYKEVTEAAIQNMVVPYKSSEESWVIKREIMDLLEISDHIRRKYLQPYDGKRTIFITDLMRISVDALRTVHQASSRIGVAQIIGRDKSLIISKQTSTFRHVERETFLRLLSHPTIMLSLLFSHKPRDFANDIEHMLNLSPKTEVEGVEHLPISGPVIIAFSHMNRWKDKEVPPNWEMARMLQEIQRIRQPKDVAFAAYLRVFIETAPVRFRKIYAHLVENVIKAVKEYSIQVIDVAGDDKSKMRQFAEQALQALREGKAVMLSPEGVPAREVLKPYRGVGMLARLSGTPVVGVAFVEEQLPDGQFRHKVVFTPRRRYNHRAIPGQTQKEKDQVFADFIMRDIAQQLPKEQRGVFR